MYDKHFLSKILNQFFNDQKVSKEAIRPKMFVKLLKLFKPGKLLQYEKIEPIGKVINPLGNLKNKMHFRN